MESFRITGRTRIEGDAETGAIRHAIGMLQGDMARALAPEGVENRIRLTRDAGLAEEAYHVQVQADAITIAYADDLGAAYGLLSLSERYLDIQPFDLWNERAVARRQGVDIPVGAYASTPQAVRFRGWFVNDEVLLDGWPDTEAQKLDMWRMIFETLLRCGGNMVIPGTDRKEDADALAEMALDMGLWISQHHTELLGARMFARAYPGVEASYRRHPALFEALWQEAIDRYAGRKVIWAVGYRGQGDSAFWESEAGFDTAQARGGMIVGVLRRQMEMVRKSDANALFCTNLYGEMMGLYRQGHLPLPPEVIKIWGDNGYGRMVNRRTGNDNPRVPSMPVHEPGQNGLYYHASFYDLQAANHITMSQNAPGMLVRELSQAAQNGAKDYWNINVGSIKPHIYILDLMRACWRDGTADVRAHAEAYAQAYYGDARVAELLLSFSGHTMPYGPNEDDRAGDQYYHFVLRHIARAMMRGETEAAMPRLVWAADERPFAGQVAHIESLCANAVPGWQEYLRACEQVAQTLTPQAERLLRDTLILQAKIHLTGCEGLRETCRAALCLQKGEPVQAFLYASHALEAHRDGVAALEDAEHGAFVHIYRNECFSNVRLTVRLLTTLRAWIRACWDGEHCYDWERRYLYAPEDRNVWCLTHRFNQLDDEALSEGLMRVMTLA